MFVCVADGNLTDPNLYVQYMTRKFGLTYPYRLMNYDAKKITS